MDANVSIQRKYGCENLQNSEHIYMYMYIHTVSTISSFSTHRVRACIIMWNL